MGRSRNKNILAQKVAKQFNQSNEGEDEESDEDIEVPETVSLNKMASLQMFSSSEEEEEEEEQLEQEKEEFDKEPIIEVENVSMTSDEKAIEEPEKVNINASKSKNKKKNKKQRNKAQNKSNNNTNETTNETNKSASDDTPPIINKYEELNSDKPLVGKEVEIINIKNENKKYLNHQRGKVIDYNPKNERYNIEIRSGRGLPSFIIALKRENIVDALTIDRYQLLLLFFFVFNSNLKVSLSIKRHILTNTHTNIYFPSLSPS